MGVLVALAILAGLIVVHEAGHFLAATLQGIRVSSFSIGFGPVLLERRWRGVQFALRVIPLGGFVGFPDDDEDSVLLRVLSEWILAGGSAGIFNERAERLS